MESDTTKRVDQPLKDPRPGSSSQERQVHRRALFRGYTLVFLGLGLLLVFGALTAAVLLLDPTSLDLPITREVQELNFGPFGWLMLAVSAPGFYPWSLIFPALLILGIAAIKRLAEAAFLALAAALGAFSDVMKAIVHRGRPSADLVTVIGHPQNFSFPSGHVTEYTLVLGFCFYLAFTLLNKGWLRTAVLVLTGGMVLLVGISRIWMGAHWASDVLGGYTLGFGLLLLAIWGYRTWEERRAGKVKPPLAPGERAARSGS